MGQARPLEGGLPRGVSCAVPAVSQQPHTLPRDRMQRQALPASKGLPETVSSVLQTGRETGS